MAKEAWYSYNAILLQSLTYIPISEQIHNYAPGDKLVIM